MSIPRSAESLATCLVIIFCSQVQAQFGPGFGFGNGNNTGSGVIINAEGVIDLQQEVVIPSATLKKQIERFSKEQLPSNVVVATKERVLSLKSLSAAVKSCLDKDKPIPPEISCLAGLYRIDAVVFDRDEHDVYLVGPADAFGPGPLGRMVSQEKGRPVLLLDDLVTVLRSEGINNGSFGCSIDPVQENVARLQQYLRYNSSPTSVDDAQSRYHQSAQILGNQNISVWGVPENSRFAQALVEADLRMKRISLGVEPAKVKGIRSQLALLKPQGNSLQRWWFVPMYDPLETNADRTVFRLKGQRAQLLAQEETTDAGGRRRDAATTRKSTQRFAQLFTENFQELADKSPAFADLQNLYDIAVCSTLIRQEARDHDVKDILATLRDDERLKTAVCPVPKLVPSLATYRSAGLDGLIGLIGGVTMDVGNVVRDTRPGEPANVSSFRTQVGSDQLFGDTPSAR